VTLQPLLDESGRCRYTSGVPLHTCGYWEGPMPRLLTQLPLALLGMLALLCLAACTPTARPATVGRAPTVPTVPPACVPAGWKVLATPHFRLAYPPDWTTFSEFDAAQEAATPITGYSIATPERHGHAQLYVSALQRVDVSDFCRAPNPQTQPPQATTLAGLPMRYLLVPYPNGGGVVRMWGFLNAQKTAYTLRASDGDASAATQAQDDAILATFRPDNTTAWQC
jgi:hypothetical protein